MLGRYYLERERAGPAVALDRASRIVARPLAIAAWTTATAFLSFLVMDVRPMRAFGLAAAAGTLLCWFFALTLVPAVMTLWPRAASREQLLPLGSALVGTWRIVERNPKKVLATMLLVVAASALPVGAVEVRMEAKAFLREGSPAWVDQRFFEERFGGARFVQIEVAGDMEDPASLREVARLADHARSLPGVAQVASLIDPLAIGTEVLSGEYRLPTTRREVAQVYLFLGGGTGLSSLVTPDRRHALVNARVGGDAAPVVAALEAYLAERLRPTPSGPTLADVVEGEDHELVAQRLQERLPETRVMTKETFHDAIVATLLGEQVGLTFGTSTAFGLLIGFIIVALSMFSSVLDNLKEFGTLKAIGSTNGDLSRLLIVQSVMYAVLGSFIGLGMVGFAAEGIRSASLAMIVPLELVVATPVVMTVLCVVASVLALRRVRKLEPGMVFR